MQPAAAGRDIALVPLPVSPPPGDRGAATNERGTPGSSLAARHGRARSCGRPGPRRVIPRRGRASQVLRCGGAPRVVLLVGGDDHGDPMVKLSDGHCIPTSALPRSAPPPQLLLCFKSASLHNSRTLPISFCVVCSKPATWCCEVWRAGLLPSSSCDRLRELLPAATSPSSRCRPPLGQATPIHLPTSCF
jgi:hypothetical protein